MALSRENKRLLLLGEFFVAHTWRCLLRSLWLFFPAILFILLGYFIFWHVVQGKDLMVITLEDPKGKSTMAEFICFVVALIFWVYVTWYSTRIVARAQQFQNPDDDAIWEIFRLQAPRVLAFTCLTVILLAFFQLKNYKFPHLESWQCHVLLAISYVAYFYINKFWTWFLEQKSRTKPDWLKFLKTTRKITHGILITWIAAVMLTKYFWGLISLLIVLQIGLVLLLIIRRELDEAESHDNIPKPKKTNQGFGFWKKARYIILHDENPNYVRFFMVICTIGLAFYIAAIVYIRFAVFIGPFPFVLLAFGVLMGFGNILSFISVLIRFNCHLLLFIIALLFGSLNVFDSHKLNLPDKENREARFDQRQNLKDYFTNWINDPERQKILLDGSAPKYPVYFVMANGGASRSGYWTAKILGELEDSSAGEFSKRLFCLSGASGGSVGTATFFSLLRAKDSLKKYNIPFAKAATDYLKSDFLTFTISHLLGPDVFRNFLPFLNWLEMDRGRALAFSLEKAPGEKCFLYDSFKVKFSSIITQKNNTHYQLPILCINATRMRDGNPAVISNLRIKQDSIQNNYFNNRIDVLDILGEDKDLKLSTAVVLGASFPYISPAGRIDKLSKDKDSSGTTREITEPHYFVDGGYFDNSGAGVVTEMIIALNNLLTTDSSLKKYKTRLDFNVLHILNTDPKRIKTDPINSMTNDLLAPAKTLLGSYGSQTTVNDQRLKSFLYSLYGDSIHYKKIDLYDNNTDPRFRFSMNWVISDKQRSLMDSALLQNHSYLKEKNKMKGWKKK